MFVIWMLGEKQRHREKRINCSKQISAVYRRFYSILFCFFVCFRSVYDWVDYFDIMCSRVVGYKLSRGVGSVVGLSGLYLLLIRIGKF